MILLVLADSSHFPHNAPIAVLVGEAAPPSGEGGHSVCQEHVRTSVALQKSSEQLFYGRIWVARFLFTSLMHLKLKRQCCVIDGLEEK